MAKELKPSPRGELEITDIIRIYLQKGKLKVEVLVEALHAGYRTAESLLAASTFVQAIETRQSLKISCIEEIAWRMGFIDEQKMIAVARSMPASEYRQYLLNLTEKRTHS